MSSANVPTLRDSASDAVDQLQQAAAPAIKEGKRQASVLIDQSGELIDNAGSRADEIVAGLAERLVAYTKKNPLMALLLAAGAGAILVGAAAAVQTRRR